MSKSNVTQLPNRRRADVARVVEIMRASLDAQERALMASIKRSRRWLDMLTDFAEGAELHPEASRHARLSESAKRAVQRATGTGDACACVELFDRFVGTACIPAETSLMKAMLVAAGTLDVGEWAREERNPGAFDCDLGGVALEAAETAGLDDLVPNAKVIPLRRA